MNILALLPLLFHVTQARIDCAMGHLSDVSPKSSGHVYCATGFHECQGHSRACCSNVSANPIELTLVILGPVALTLALAMLIALVLFIYKTRSENDVMLTSNKRRDEENSKAAKVNEQRSKVKTHGRVTKDNKVHPTTTSF